MAKGQMRSNRETRKPKKEKSAPKAESGFGHQVKDSKTPSPGTAPKK